MPRTIRQRRAPDRQLLRFGGRRRRRSPARGPESCEEQSLRDRRAGATLDISSGAIAGISDTPAVPPSEFASCFALPGLVDMHVHLPPDNALKLTQGAALLYPCTA